HFLYLSRQGMNLGDACEWYGRCLLGQAQLPGADGKDASRHALLLQPFLSEPPWPGPQVPSMRLPGPVAEHMPERAASLLPAHSAWIDDLWSPEERASAVAWLRDRVDFDFRVDPEYLGAVHLVAIDPELAELSVVRALNEPASAFAIDITPTWRTSADGYSFVFRE